MKIVTLHRRGCLSRRCNLFQFREKGVGTLVGQQKLELAQQLQQICAKYNVLYVINDDVDLAMAVNADGVRRRTRGYAFRRRS